MKRRVLVTGVTGKQGGSVAMALLKDGHEVSGITRNTESTRAWSLAGHGVKLHALNFSNEEALQELMTQVDTVFAMTTPFEDGVEGEVRQGISLVNAAQKAGVGHFVLSSVGDADGNTGIPHFDSKNEVEKHLGKLDMPWSIVAPSYFMDNLFFPFVLDGVKQGILKMAMPGGRVLQQIAVEDIGKFVSKVIGEREPWFGKRINISGDEITGNEVAAILTIVLGKEIRFEGFDPAYLKGQSEDMALMYEWFNSSGYTARLSDMEPYGFLSYKEWARIQDWDTLLSA